MKYNDKKMYFLQDLLRVVGIKSSRSELVSMKLGAILLKDKSKGGQFFVDIHDQLAGNFGWDVDVFFSALGEFAGHLSTRSDFSAASSSQRLTVHDFGVDRRFSLNALFFLRRNFSVSQDTLVSFNKIQKYKQQRTVYLRRTSDITSDHVEQLPFFLTMEGSNVKHAIKLFAEEALSLGAAAQFLRLQPLCKNALTDNIINRIHHPMTLDQAKIFYDEHGGVIGFVTWAWVTDDQEDWYRNAGTRALDEWTFGRTLCVCDAIASPGHENLVTDFVADLYPEEKYLVCSAADRQHARHKAINRSALRYLEISTGIDKYSNDY